MSAATASATAAATAAATSNGGSDAPAAHTDLARLLTQQLSAGSYECMVCINPVAPDPDAIDGLLWRMGRGQEWVDVGPSTVGEIAYERLPIGSVLNAAAMGAPGPVPRG